MRVAIHQWIGSSVSAEEVNRLGATMTITTRVCSVVNAVARRDRDLDETVLQDEDLQVATIETAEVAIEGDRNATAPTEIADQRKTILPVRTLTN